MGPGGQGVYLDFADAIRRLGRKAIEEKYGNLFEMYERITDEDPYSVPDAHLPGHALHDGRAVGGLQPHEHHPGLFVLGEANFSDHGANRLGASALMQGLADGYFIIPYTIGNYLAANKHAPVSADHPAVKAAEKAVAERTATASRRPRQPSPSHFHRELGKIMWEHCGMARTEAGLEQALQRLPALREEFWKDVKVAGQRRVAEPVARARRPGRRLPGAGRADVPRRAGAPRVLRRPLPRGVPDAGRRGPARRRAVLPRGGLGVRGRGEEAHPARRAARLRKRAPRGEELQVDRPFFL